MINKYRVWYSWTDDDGNVDVEAEDVTALSWADAGVFVSRWLRDTNPTIDYQVDNIYLLNEKGFVKRQEV